MNRAEAKAYIDGKLTDFIRQKSPEGYFSSNLIEKDKWTKAECDSTIAELITWLAKRRKKRVKK